MRIRRTIRRSPEESAELKRLKRDADPAEVKRFLTALGTYREPVEKEEKDNG